MSKQARSQRKKINGKTSGGKNLDQYGDEEVSAWILIALLILTVAIVQLYGSINFSVF